MKYEAVFDLIIHPHNFRNIDLYYQGVYYFQISIQHPSAAPYQIENQFDVTSFHQLKAPSIIHHRNSIQSKIILIRFQDQLVHFNQTYFFRALISNPDQALKLRVKLMFSNLGHENTGVSTQEAEKIFQAQFPEFKQVARLDFTIRDIFKGVNQYLPVVFSDVYSSVIMCTVHCMLLDYQFSTQGELINQPSQLDEFFFPAAFQNLSIQRISLIYKFFVHPLIKTHNKICKLLLQARKKCNTGKKKKEFPKLIKSSQVQIQKFLQALTSRKKSLVSTNIYISIKKIAASLCQSRYFLSDFLKTRSNSLVNHLQSLYQQKSKQKADLCFYPQFQLQQSQNGQKHKHIKKYSIHRNLIQNIPSLKINLLLSKIPAFPVIFQQLSSDQPLNQSSQWLSNSFLTTPRQYSHLIILVHGWMSTAFDMKLVKDILALHLPNALIIISRANQNFTQSSIQFMGQRLANQVYRYIHDFLLLRQDTKISFIGHSLGGVIIRAALPLLVQFRN